MSLTKLSRPTQSILLLPNSSTFSIARISPGAKFSGLMERHTYIRRQPCIAGREQTQG
jgi:hypothetical protein